MSRFSGTQPNFGQEVRKKKREEAVKRNLAANACVRLCGHVHGDAQSLRDECCTRAVDNVRNGLDKLRKEKGFLPVEKGQKDEL
jgi:hypothetical protein